LGRGRIVEEIGGGDRAEDVGDLGLALGGRESVAGCRRRGGRGYVGWDGGWFGSRFERFGFRTVGYGGGSGTTRGTMRGTTRGPWRGPSSGPGCWIGRRLRWQYVFAGCWTIGSRREDGSRSIAALHLVR
jgi:hypothetical protein